MSNFNEVKNPNLRALNRLMYAVSLRAGYGDERVREYFSSMDERDLHSIALVEEVLLRYGYKKGRSIVLKDVEYEEDKEQLDFLDQIERDFDLETGYKEPSANTRQTYEQTVH